MVKKKVKPKTDWSSLSSKQKRLCLIAALLPTLVLGYGLYRNYINPIVIDVYIDDIFKIRHTETRNSDVDIGYVQYTTIYTVGKGKYIFDSYVEVDKDKDYHIRCISYRLPYYYHLVSIEEVNNNE